MVAVKPHLRRAARLCPALAVAAWPREASAQAPPGGGRVKQPRILVLTFEKTSGQVDESQRDKIQGVAEEVCQELQFPLVDASQLLAHYEISDLEKLAAGIGPSLSAADRARLAELKVRFGAELLVTVNFTRTFKYERDLYGTIQRFFTSDVRVKAILPDTAEIVHSTGGSGQVEATTRNLEKLAREHVAKALDAILARAGQDSFGSPLFQISVAETDSATLMRFEDNLKRTPGMVDVTERSFGGHAVGKGNALVEVRYSGSTDELKRTLVAMDDPGVEILSSTPNRVEVRLLQKAKPNFPPQIEIVEPADGALLGGEKCNVLVRATDEDLAGVEVNGTPAQPGAGDGIFSAEVWLKGGANTLVARAIDSGGNTAEAKRTVNVDVKPPQVSIVSPAEGAPLRSRRATVVVSAKDDIGIARVTVNGQTAKPQGGDRFTADVDLSEGKGRITAVAEDGVGNRSQAAVSVMVDTTPPSIEAEVEMIIQGRLDDPEATLTLDGKPVEVGRDGRYRIVVRGAGGSTVKLVATDKFGNQSEKVIRLGEGK